MTSKATLLSLSISLILAAVASGELAVTSIWPFVSVTTAAGIHFKHHSGATPQKYMYEAFGSGGAFIDYDNDGWQDIYLVNGGERVNSGPGLSFRNHGNTLYRNRGDGSFEDVTAQAGVAGRDGYGMGVAVGDYDNDGHEDLFVTYIGGDVLYHNNGDGTFSDVTQRAGLSDSKSDWSTSAVFFDFDNDGLLDLFVCKYVEVNQPLGGCTLLGQPVYCHPDNFAGTSSKLYRNMGNGTFRDVTTVSGIGSFKGKALGAVAVDFNNDGWTDLFVANDMTPNALWKNNGNNMFTNIALLSGTGLGENGAAEAGMGVDAADYDGDGRPDFVVTHYAGETTALFRNDGNGFFTDTRWAGRVAVPGLGLVGWGTGFLDFDNDGQEDLFVANGHLIDNIQLLRDDATYGQRSQLYVNKAGSFGDILYSPDLRVGRGVAFGDFDNDGKTDILVTNNNQEPILYHNVRSGKNHWITIQLVGTKSNRDGIGSKVTVAAGGKIQVKHAKGGGSYLSASDHRLHFGLGNSSVVEQLTVRWPSGAIEEFRDVDADQFVRIEECKGIRKVEPVLRSASGQPTGEH